MTPLTTTSAADDDNNDKYVLIEELSEGFFKARSPEGEFVLLKKIPFSCLNSWHEDYIRYRSEIIRRVKENRVEYCELSIYLDLLWIKQIEGGQFRQKVNVSGYRVFPKNSPYP